MTSPSNILIIQTSFIGDVILATALLESIHQESPEANLSILVRKGNESLFEHHPFIKQVIVWDKKQGKYSSLWKTIRKVRAEKFDWIINTHRFASSGIMTWLSGASRETFGAAHFKAPSKAMSASPQFFRPAYRHKH